MSQAKTKKKIAKKKAAKKISKTDSQSLRQFIGKAASTNVKGKLLVMVDETAESLTALRFAGISAKRLNSNVALLMVLEAEVMRHWLGVETIMKEEARKEAMDKMQILAGEITDYANITPDIFIREGTKFEALTKLVEEDQDITAIVIGVASADQPVAPGPLVNKLLSGELEKLGLPVIIVPENIAENTLRRIARIL